MKAWWHSGRPWVWLTSGAVSLSLLAMLALLALLTGQSLRLLWPQPIYSFDLISPPGVLLGERVGVQRPLVPTAGVPMDPEIWLIRTGNRPQDSYRLPAAQVRASRLPADVLVVQRRNGARLYGYLAGMREDGQPLTAASMSAALEQRLRLSATQRRLAAQVEQQRSAVRAQRAQQQSLPLHRQGVPSEQQRAAQQAAQNERQTAYEALSEQLAAIERERGRVQLVLADAQGQRQVIPLSDIDSLWYPNAMSLGQKLRHLAAQTWRFVSLHDPVREGDGVFPAMAGTLLLVILMSVIVMPLGVMAAIYLHEYAARHWLTRLIRIAVGNLAGVPSIVYGIFGLGFFVYAVGGSLDKLFYADTLPAPTFGTPGLLWAALTLALLTLPVVIIATEEGLARIPPSLRQGSLALGATQAETIWRVVLPGAAPAMMTGLILAVARAAGETAPLMLVGVIKSAPKLPLDGTFPFLHPERQFMHLGYQIYDLAFQSQDGDAVQPMAFATALLLIVIVVSLNLAAMGLRHRLREKYRALTL
ncbi:phosphate ABC transporter permease PstA [Sodalis praecaptivus]|nr:phosphate ABC transporter permease PstA [Sodalis praecaptivus]